MGIGIGIGGGSFTTLQDGRQNYTILGISADYYVIDNLSVGIGYKGWFGGTPSLNQLAIPVTYYIPASKKVRPYVGVFVKKTFVSDGYDDFESYGGKLGVAIVMAPNSYVGIGYAAERYSSCGTWQDECSTSYPELVFAFSF